ncbi:MAG: DUF4199 domain-containing protein [Bacteroidales bacterium]|nr:DUF4199 domain-containing protein [Bacteroidales bacterium]
MEQNVIQKNMWNTAGKAGLILGGISTAYLFITQWMGQAELPAFLTIILTGVLWCAKFGGCIWFMMFFMKSFAAENPEADNNRTFKLGMAIAFLSALVYSAFSLANVAFISPDLFTEQMDMIMQQMAPMMDSNTAAQMDKTMQNLPQLTFFSNLIYCFIFGTILSFALSRSIPSKDPFADYKPEDQ